MKKSIILMAAVLLTNTVCLADKAPLVPILNLVLGDSTPTNCSTDVATVTTPTGRVWMDRNLGASQVATSKEDLNAYGYLYQWGRLTDGHQERTSGVTNLNETSPGTTPGHDNFILSQDDWIKPPNENLWQGLNSINNPCPPCFRLPTKDEWNVVSNGWKNSDDAFNSPLKLVVAGLRNRANSGSIDGAGTHGFYWSSDVSGSPSYSWYFGFEPSNAFLDTRLRAYGKSVRCIQH